MRIYSNKSVYDAALERIRYIFDEFPQVILSYSGGKDSTVIFNLAIQVAKEKGRLPLDVLIIDQEAEWTSTVEMYKFVAYNKDVRPLWLQMPIGIENSATFGETYQECWEEGKEWLREKDPISKKVNDYGVHIWTGIFDAIIDKEYPNTKACYISGVRTEESPRRFMGLTEHANYKWITWGNVANKKLEHYTFYPLYDWSYTDIWKCIHDNNWKYNSLYDYQYRYGVSVNNMRVSNLHHETAIRSLFYLQEIDPPLYEKMTQRMAGVDTAGKMGFANFFPKKLPFMFKDWLEYRDFLMTKLVNDEELRKVLNSYAKRWDEIFKDDKDNQEKSAQVIIKSMITGDVGATKLKNHHNRFVCLYKRDKQRMKDGYYDEVMIKSNDKRPASK